MPISSSPRRDARLFRGLQYFESVARHQSVKNAAIELGVSQSAVSHQLRELTEVLGEPLLVKSGRGIALSPQGQRLATSLSLVFADFRSSVNEVLGAGRQVLRIAVCTSFGPGWLIPRLETFISKNPDTDLRVCLYTEDPKLTDQVADAIVSAAPLQKGFANLRIIDEFLVPVCAPGQEGRPQRLITTEYESPDTGSDWLSYCSRADLRLSEVQVGTWLQCSHYVAAIEMAKSGLGAALVPQFLAAREIESGRAALWHEMNMPSGRTYNLYYKKSRQHEPAIQALIHWLKGQIGPRSVIRPASIQKWHSLETLAR